GRGPSCARRSGTGSSRWAVTWTSPSSCSRVSACGSVGRRRKWKRDDDRGSAAGSGLIIGAAAVGVHDPCDDREPETGTPAGTGAGGIRPVETFEDALGLSGRDPGTVVADLDDGVLGPGAGLDLHGRALGGVVRGVAHEVHEYLPDAVGIPPRDDRLRGDERGGPRGIER